MEEDALDDALMHRNLFIRKASAANFASSLIANLGLFKISLLLNQLSARSLRRLLHYFLRPFTLQELAALCKIG